MKYRFRGSADLVMWTLLCITVGVMALAYLSLGLAASRGPLIMPLDDTYIYFQYARQMAHGHPYIYNPGDPPTSGATSLLYVPLLAVGYGLGFQGLALAYWAVGWGALALLISAWLVYRLIRFAPGAAPGPPQRVIACLIMLAYALSGPFVWAAFSGMETTLFVCAVLLALETVRAGRPVPALLVASLAALIRPEGSVIALTVLLALGWRAWRARTLKGWYLLPLLAVIVQPVLNWLLTGTPAASGTQIKSHLYNQSLLPLERLDTVLDFWTRMWHELITGRSPVSGPYIPPGLAILALLAVIAALRVSWRQRDVTPALLAGIWMLLLTVADATLDTAFWQFKRYQLPVMALMFPLAGWVLVWLAARRGRWGIGLAGGLAAGIVVMTLPTISDYACRYYENIVVTRDQQVAMACWVHDHLPRDAWMAVHDVGAMRYIGNRPTYDVVGLTTRDVGQAWRQGPGAFYDTLIHHDPRPGYFAIYPDFHGMPSLIQAGVFGEELARFEVKLPRYTASAATGTQVVARIGGPAEEDQARQPNPQIDRDAWTLVGMLDVGDLHSESEVDYGWWNRTTPPGFASNLYRLSDAVCDLAPCEHVDGTRALTGGERFRLPPVETGQDYLVILRVHAASPAALKQGCDQPRSVQVVPGIPGYWVEIAFWLPAGSPDARARRFCVESSGGVYDPARYWIYAGHYTPAQADQTPRARLFEPGDQAELDLLAADPVQSADALTVTVSWYTDHDLTRDGTFFVHLYTDPAQPPAAQMDVRPGRGILPPGNWLPGGFQETVSLPLHDVPPGRYTLAVGMYDPVSGDRYTVIGPDGVPSDRLLLGEITR